ncbi:unnamed protein product, partial [Didymodactylos carnosus]
EEIQSRTRELDVERENLTQNEQLVTELENQKQGLETEKQQLARIWQQLDDQRVDYLNELYNVKLKLTAVEDSLKNIQLKISNCEDQHRLQNAQLEYLRGTCQELENDLAKKNDECESLHQRKEESAKELQQAEQLLTQLKQQERELANMNGISPKNKSVWL